MDNQKKLFDWKIIEEWTSSITNKIKRLTGAPASLLALSAPGANQSLMTQVSNQQGSDFALHAQGQQDAGAPI